MRLTPEELRKLGPALLFALVLIAAGVAVIWGADATLAAARRQAATAQAERQQATERLARISEEEREVIEKLDVYKRLKQLNILGEERRLEWADAITRIRTQRELLDLSYRVDRQRLLASVAGKPANVEFFASTMRVQLALLHEEDLLRFLADLRDSGNAYYAVRQCSLTRIAQPPAGVQIAPRLRGDCDIDLITIVDRGAKG